MKKVLTNLALEAIGGKEVLREAVKAAILEALEEALQEEAPAPRRKAKAKAEAEVEAKASKAVVQAEPKAKAPRRKGPEADGAEVRRLAKALADLGAHLGKSPGGKEMSEVLSRRAETIAHYARPGQAAKALAGVLDYLHSLTLEEAKKAALRGYRDLAEAAGVGHLLRPKA